MLWKRIFTQKDFSNENDATTLFDTLQFSLIYLTFLNLKFMIVLLLYFVDQPNPYHLDFIEAHRLRAMSQAKERDNKVVVLGNPSKLSRVH